MTCDEVRALLPEVLTGPGERSKVEEHLAGCASCRREAEEAARAIALVRAAAPAAGPVEPPPFDDVLAAARASSRAPRWLARAAALLLAALAGAAADRIASRAPVVASASPIERTRAEVAGDPGSLRSSLALLGAMSRR